MITETGRMRALKKLIELREVGGYDLPAAVVEAYQLTIKVAALPVEPAAFLHEDAAVALVAAVGKGETPNLVELGGRVSEAVEAASRVEHAARILATAREKADYSALAEMQRRADEIVVNHLRPVYGLTLDRARRDAALLGGHPTDPSSIVTAAAKVRSAWASLRDSAQQYRVVRQARQLANDAGGRVPEHDLQDQYATFRDPFSFFPEPGAPRCRRSRTRARTSSWSCGSPLAPEGRLSRGCQPRLSKIRHGSTSTARSPNDGASPTTRRERWWAADERQNPGRTTG